MSTKLDIEELHLQAETAEDIIKVYQECHLGDFLDEGKKNPPSPQSYTKGAIITLFIATSLYVVNIILVSGHFEFLNPYYKTLIAVCMIWILVASISLHIIFKKWYITGLGFIASLLILGYSSDVYTEKETLERMQKITPAPSELIKNYQDSVSQ